MTLSHVCRTLLVASTILALCTANAEVQEPANCGPASGRIRASAFSSVVLSSSSVGSRSSATPPYDAKSVRVVLLYNGDETELPVFHQGTQDHYDIVIPETQGVTVACAHLELRDKDNASLVFQRTQSVAFWILPKGSNAAAWHPNPDEIDTMTKLAQHMKGRGQLHDAMQASRCAFERDPAKTFQNYGTRIEFICALAALSPSQQPHLSEALELAKHLQAANHPSRVGPEFSWSITAQFCLVRFAAESVVRGQTWWWQPVPAQTMMDSHFSTGLSRPAAPDSVGTRSGVELLQWEEEFVSCIQALFDSGCNSTLTVHHAITQLFMLTPTENTALSLRLKYLTLHAERAHLRAKSGAELVVAEVHEAGRIDSPRRQSVVIYIRQLLDEINEAWGPSSLIQKGIGGAGEAVVWLARKFAQMGYFTEVYGNVPDADLGFDDGGVMWRQFWEYDERTRCDVFVVWWDHLDSVAIGAAARARYVWLHYGQYIDRWPPVAAASIDAVFPMSQFHANQLPQHAQDKVIVSANGLAPHLYADGPNDTWNLIYASHPFYGLDTLLRMWPAIAAALPNVTLHVYYGFTPGIDRYLSNFPEGAAFKKKIMDALTRGPRIVYYGMVGAQELARAVAAAGFYVYPCTIAEISSISLMRAQAMGAIPITSRHINSALPETAGIFDLGPPARPGLISDDDDWQSDFVQAVVRAVNAPRSEMDRHRSDMKAWARETFDWDRVAAQWHGVFQKHLSASAGRLNGEAAESGRIGEL